MKEIPKKVFIFLVGCTAGTFLMNKLSNFRKYKNPEHITIDHAQIIHNQKFLSQNQISPDKFSNENIYSKSLNLPHQHSTSFRDTQTTPQVNKNSPYSSLMYGNSKERKL